MDTETLNDMMEARTIFSRILEGTDPKKGREAYQFILKMREEKKKFLEEVRDEVREEVRNQVKDEVRDEVRDQVRNEAQRALVLNLIKNRFSADEDKWRERLADLDEAQLNALILRVVEARSEQDLDP